jgi:DegV family protein with EDD domain
MNDYVIATASTCDLDVSWLKEHHVPFIPYSFIINEKSYEDKCNEETKDFILSEMKQDHAVSTAAITIFAYYDFFETFAKQGKDVILLDMTQALSSSYSNSLVAARDIHDKYPNVRIEVVDTCAVTLILGLLVKQTVAMHENGATMDEVIDWINANKQNYVGRFMVDDLKWLRRGGRLSNASAVVGSLLSIKPMIIVDPKGKLVAYNKVRGTIRARKQLIQDTGLNMTDETKNYETALIYSGEREEGEEFLKEFRETYPQLTNVNLYRLGPVIMGHIGPGFLATVIYGSKRGEK